MIPDEVFGAAVAFSLVLVWQSNVANRIRRWLWSFDMDVREAVSRLADAIPLSYDRQSLADEHLLKLLYEEMAIGNLLVSWTDMSGRMHRIGKKSVASLEAVSVVIPGGTRFSLIRRNEDFSFEEYSGLRIRSRDFFRIWPNAKRQKP